MTKRRQYTAGFKFKVALEAAKELKTRSQVASEFGVVLATFLIRAKNWRMVQIL